MEPIIRLDDVPKPYIAFVMGPYTRAYGAFVKDAVHDSLRAAQPSDFTTTARSLLEEVEEGVVFLHMVVSFPPDITEEGLQIFSTGMAQIARMAFEAFIYGRDTDPDTPLLEAYCARYHDGPPSR